MAEKCRPICRRRKDEKNLGGGVIELCMSKDTNERRNSNKNVAISSSPTIYVCHKFVRMNHKCR